MAKASSRPVETLWEPTPKQNDFLAAGEFEVLYGGAVGGGKSDSLLIDALGIQQNALTKRGYQALLVRRTYPDLKDLIDRSMELYPEIAPGAVYDKTEHVWRFPSGARVEFGHCQYESDRFKYRGRAFQYVGLDELTLFPTPSIYLYLMSRVRTVDKSITCYVRATTNPDGPGSRWVREHWRIPIEGTATLFEVELVDPETKAVTFMARRFIPARLSDNKYLADSGYREQLLLLPEDEQNALLLGRWEKQKVKGAYFAEAMEQAHTEGRIRNIPVMRNLPVNTFWDLGWNDTTAIWFHQAPVRMEHRFIDCYENRNKTIPHYMEVLADKGYLLGKAYVPHDAEHRSLNSGGKSTVDLIHEAMPNLDIVVVEKIDNVVIGINETRNMLPTAWFDAERCADGLAAIENYRREWDDRLQDYKPTPLHDWASNYADALRQWGQGWRAPVKQGKSKKRPNWRTV